jgi:hypothetical protein
MNTGGQSPNAHRCLRVQALFGDGIARVIADGHAQRPNG